MSTLAAVLFGLIMFAVGGAIGFYFSRLDQSARAARQDEVQQEFDAYRTKVAEHFGKTADQFHAIGIQYRELYEHLAEGSAALCELDGPTGTAPFPPAIAAADGTGRPEAVADSADADAAAGIDESRSEEPSKDHEPGVDAQATADAEPAPDADQGEGETADRADGTELEPAAETGSEHAVRDEAVDVEDSDEPLAAREGTEQSEKPAQPIDGGATDDAESTPDNVVELMPRAEADVEAEKKSYN